MFVQTTARGNDEDLMHGSEGIETERTHWQSARYQRLWGGGQKQPATQESRMTSANLRESVPIAYSFIAVPRIGRTEVLYHKNGKIRLNGANSKAEIWAKEKAMLHEILEDFVMAMQDNIDSRFAIKLLEPVHGGGISRHPSDPDWAYSKISLADIPLHSISDREWASVLSEMKAFEDGTWSEDPRAQDLRSIFRI